MEEKDIKEAEENKEETTAVNETVETVSEDNKIKVDKKALAKKNTVYAVAALVAIAILLVLVFTNVKKDNTYKLSSIYPTYFAEVDGEIKLPKDWAYTEVGQLFKNEDNKLTLVGQVLGAEMSEEDFATTVDALKNYYELSEITVNGNTGYKVHTEDESGTFDICIFHNGNTYLQIGLMNVSEDEVNTVINSIKF